MDDDWKGSRARREESMGARNGHNMNEAEMAERKYLLGLIKEVGGSFNVSNQRGGVSLSDMRDYARVCVKYNRFDLEATRRENDYLWAIIQKNNL